MALPSSYQEALQVGAVEYCTGKPCKHGHVASRYVCNKGCAECQRNRNRLWMDSARSRNRAHFLNIERRSRERAKKRLGTAGWKRRSKKYNLKKYGLTLKQFDEMLIAQGNNCAICQGPPGNRNGFHVDHDHETGAVRGLLCHTCNQGMIAVDRVDGWFEKAARYADSERRASLSLSHG